MLFGGIFLVRGFQILFGEMFQRFGGMLCGLGGCVFGGGDHPYSLGGGRLLTMVVLGYLISKFVLLFVEGLEGQR